MKIESSYLRNGDRCDLIAIDNKTMRHTAIEVKTAWAGTGWTNKPKEQVTSWLKDETKIISLEGNGHFKSSYFILCFIYEDSTKAELKLRNEIQKFNTTHLDPICISNWNGLNRIQFFIKKIF